MFLLAQRVFFALCLISLLGCSSTSCREWEFQEISTNFQCFRGGRLVLGPETNYTHLELELVRNRSGIRFYINLLFAQAHPLSNDQTRTRIEIRFNEEDVWEVYPYLLEGGQRLLLPGDVADILVKALLDDLSFTIQIGRNQIEAIPFNFTTSYQSLLDIPILEDALPQ
jgi:hypothetical protein